MERLFKLKEHNTDVRTEITAGITTFLSMVYILAVNPNILSAAGMNPSAVFTATAVSGAIATLFMAFLANYREYRILGKLHWQRYSWKVWYSYFFHW